MCGEMRKHSAPDDYSCVCVQKQVQNIFEHLTLKIIIVML